MRSDRLPLPALVLGAVLAGLWLAAPPWITAAQARLFDILLPLTPAPEPDLPVMVVDIGATDEAGRPWDRAATARLQAAVAAAGPAVIVHDILYAGDCDSPATAALAQGIAAAPTVLAALLAPAPMGAEVTPPPVAVDQAAGAGLIAVPGIDAPCAALAAAAAGVGSAALFGDPDATVRLVAVAVLAEGRILPALPLAAAMVAGGGGLPVLAGDRLMLGGRAVTLDPGAGLRLRPFGVAQVVDAASVLRGADTAMLAGAVVVIGSSLPQRGGLRPTAAGPLTPSVQIVADATAALLSGTAPARPLAARWAEAAAILTLAAVAAAGLARLSPLAALAAMAGGAALWAGGALAAVSTGVLADPAGPLVAGALPGIAALAARAAATARAERRLRASLSQRLPAAVVARIAGDPALFRREGELREVTALFTDIAGFSTTARALGPRDLVRVLDGYFDLVGGIILSHGGMVDKIVGDGVHALFNAPLDQPGHPDRAIACAEAIVAATEAFRATGAGAAAGLGPTRVGIETGPAVLGDVGSRGRIDYTAHGDAVNLAARLQDINKVTGTRICIGPGAAARATVALRPLGEVEVRSFGALALFTPQPASPPRQRPPQSGPAPSA